MFHFDVGAGRVTRNAAGGGELGERLTATKSHSMPCHAMLCHAMERPREGRCYSWFPSSPNPPRLETAVPSSQLPLPDLLFTARFARERGYVCTLTGRRRHLPDINNSRNATARAQAERQAVNSVVQVPSFDAFCFSFFFCSFWWGAHGQR